MNEVRNLAAVGIEEVHTLYVGEPAVSTLVSDYLFLRNNIKMPQFWNNYRDNLIYHVTGSNYLVLYYQVNGGNHPPGVLIPGLTMSPSNQPVLLNSSQFADHVALILNGFVDNVLLSTTPWDLAADYNIVFPPDVVTAYREMQGRPDRSVRVSWINRRMFDCMGTTGNMGAGAQTTPVVIPSTAQDPAVLIRLQVENRVNVAFVRRIEIDATTKKARWVWGTGYRRHVTEVPVSTATHVVENDLTDWVNSGNASGMAAFQKLVSLGNAVRLANDWP